MGDNMQVLFIEPWLKPRIHDFRRRYGNVGYLFCNISL